LFLSILPFTLYSILSCLSFRGVVFKNKRNFTSNCCFHAKVVKICVLSKNVVSRPVRFTGRPTWRGKINVNLRCISVDCNGIAGGADNRFAPLEWELLTYCCDCKRHLCLKTGKVWASVSFWVMGTGFWNR
jgi:hypothetical protein